MRKPKERRNSRANPAVDLDDGDRIRVGETIIAVAIEQAKVPPDESGQVREEFARLIFDANGREQKKAGRFIEQQIGGYIVEQELGVPASARLIGKTVLDGPLMPSNYRTLREVALATSRR